MNSVIVTASGIEEMAQHVGKLSGLEVYCTKTTRFANGETKPTVPDVSGKHVYLFHPMSVPDPNNGLVDLLLTLDGFKRNGVKNVTLIAPYMTYQRQDRVDERGAPVSARVVADVLQMSGILERIITVDMHSAQIQGMFTIPVTNISGGEALKSYYSADALVVSPDAGGLKRARKFAQSIGSLYDAGMVEKQRTGPNKSEAFGYYGPSVQGRHVILYDDLIDTGGTLTAAAQLLYQQGAHKVSAAATHGLFTKGTGRFVEAGIDVTVTNTLVCKHEGVRVCSVDELIALEVKA